MPLTISIQPSSSVPIYRQIVEQVCAAVLAGRPRGDEPLPSVRGRAEPLLVNPNTVWRAGRVCAAVVRGRLREDEPLPSVRVLAEQLLVNPNTVSRAWSELVRDGVLESRPGRRMFVSQRPRTRAPNGTGGDLARVGGVRAGIHVGRDP